MPEAADLRVVVGQGVSGTIGGDEWRIGHEQFVTGEMLADDHTHTRVCLGTGSGVVAIFTLEDELRHDAKDTVDVLRGAGLEIALLSGDNAQPVARTAAALDIEDFRANCTPEDKLASIKAAQDEGEIVVMVGDGINDAPVLAGADTSVALAHGATLAQTSADIIMPGESLHPVMTGIRVARKTMRIVRQNLAWAIVYNATALPLAAMGHVPPWAAAIGMSASSLIVVLNALRLSRYGKAPRT